MIISKDSSLPLHAQIKAEIASRIFSHVYIDRIDSELKLVEEFNVSRGTIQKAIDALVAEKLLIREQGKGTFINQEKVEQKGFAVPSFTSALLEQGRTAEVNRLCFKEMKASKPIVRKMALEDDDRVYLYERIISSEGQPIALVSSHINAQIFPMLSEKNLCGSLYQTMRAWYRRGPVSMEDHYSPINAPDKIARQLSIPIGKAIFKGMRTAWDQYGKVIEYVESYFTFETIAVSIKRNPLGPAYTQNGNEDHENGWDISLRLRDIES